MKVKIKNFHPSIMLKGFNIGKRLITYVSELVSQSVTLNFIIVEDAIDIVPYH